MDRSTHSRNWGAAKAVLAGVLGLILVAELFSFSRSRSVEASIRQLVQEAERSTYVIGDLGHLLSRLQANVLEALTEDPQGAAWVRERFEITDESLRGHLAELPGLLSPEELELWRAIEPEVTGLRQSLADAMGLVDQGRKNEAEAELDVLAGGIRRILDSTRSFLEFNQLETRDRLASADRLLARTRMLQLGVALVLFFGVAVIALLAIRGLRRKESEVATHLEGIERANRDLEAFAGRVAHDLRNVLAPLQLSAQVLRVSATDPDVVLETAGRIERVTRAAGDMLSGLLAFARAGAARPSATARVDKELRAVLEELDPLITELGATVEIDSDPALVVRCESALLHAVLLNLVGNAVKFLAGRPTRRVRVHAASAGGRCTLSVEDSGPGIPGAALERIFEPFFRAPGAAASGFGIGLATVRRIVDAHDGRIEVTSVEGEGTRFRVTLPLGSEPLGPLPRPARQVAHP